MSRVAELLRESADRIRFGGLAKNILQDGDAYCVVGAICAVSASALLCTSAIEAVADELGLDRYRTWLIPQWNNAPERTADEVVEVLLRAAKRVENTP